MPSTTTAKSSRTSGTTRGRLIEAGLDIFGEHGFTPATTRMIADRAGVNLAAIPYHFGGKEGLYVAVIDHITTTVREEIDPILDDINDRFEQENLNPEEAWGLLESLLRRLVYFIVGSREAPRFSRIILREQMSPSNTYNGIYAGIMHPVLTTTASLLMVILKGTTEMKREIDLHAFILIGQIMAFRFARESLVRNLGLTGYSADETEEIHRIVLKQIRAALYGLTYQSGRKR